MLQVSMDGAIHRGMRLELLSRMAKRIVKKRTRQRPPPPPPPLPVAIGCSSRLLMTMTRPQNLQIHLSVDPDPTDSVNPDPKPQGPHQNVAIIAWTRGYQVCATEYVLA